MEKVKVALLAMIAAGLLAQVAGSWMPEARAAEGEIVCEAWERVVFSGVTGKEKILSKSRAYGDEVKAFLLQHPGSIPMFRTTLTYSGGAPATDVMCVRMP